CLDFRDEDVIRNHALRARRLGYTGVLCIHPAQVAPVETALRPSAAQREWAHTVLAAAGVQPGPEPDGAVEEGAAQPGVAQAGAVQSSGRMVDAPVLEQARRILADTEEDR